MKFEQLDELWTTAGTELRTARVAARRRLGTLPPRAATLRHATSQLARANDALARRLNANRDELEQPIALG